MPPDNEIDDVEYMRGYAGFKAGGSIRAIIERGAAATSEAAEVAAFSAGIGFLDAMFDQLRGINRDFAAASEETRR